MRTLPLLPIHDALPAVRAALALAPNAILQAPAGAGKTTIVPLALLDEPWISERRIIMLEPRRLAARNAAHRMATLLDERIGESVGYRVRRDTRIGPRTRIEVVTEGVLTRLLSADPTLDGVALVIFDEFHERSIHADLGLALTLHTQRLVRPDLRLLVMSATLDASAVARLLGDAPIVSSEGRMFPVERRWVPRRAEQTLEGAVAAVVRRALPDVAGDLLVFLPGQGEIHRTAALLGDLPSAEPVDVCPLYGNLPFDAQDRAIAPSPPGRRKVVLATSIAESSLTIEGVRCVIDSGLSRVARFSVRSGMTRLETVRVSAASADQRAGRAGRLAPGVCYRLWAMEEDGHLLPFSPPEIRAADLAPLALELAAAGIDDAASLTWLDPPSPSGMMHARTLLTWLGALDSSLKITTLGARMAKLGTHPRIAHMLLRTSRSDRSIACDLAALLEERDLVRDDDGHHDADLRLRIDLLSAARRRERLPDRLAGMRVLRDAVHRAVDAAAAWRHDVGASADQTGEAEADDVGRVLAFAYPDRIAQRRSGHDPRYLLRNGAGAVLRDSPSLVTSPYLVVAEADGRRPESAIWLASPISEEDVMRDFSDQVERVETLAWDDDTRTVISTRSERLGAIVLREVPVPLGDVDLERVRRVLVDAIRRSGLALLPWTDAVGRLRDRLRFAHAYDAAWPDVSDTALLASLDDWLGPQLAARGMHARGEPLSSLDLSSLLLDRLTWQQRARFDALVPTHVIAPTGSRLLIDYSDASAPSVAVRLQELFGSDETPRILDGRVTLTLQLLSPAYRPVQVTRDLASFWRTSYFDVRKDLKGRYPRHHWPDDPLAAAPTRRAKPRGT